MNEQLEIEADAERVILQLEDEQEQPHRSQEVLDLELAKAHLDIQVLVAADAEPLAAELTDKEDRQKQALDARLVELVEQLER